jgi:LmbE family N-acetylglucosaminyl deacetylase
MTAFAVSEDERGTDEEVWLPALERLAAFPLPRGRIAVLSPHPDDEVLGVGGLLVAARCPVDVIAITSGERSHPGRPGLAAVREAEQLEALGSLGLEVRIARLGVPDGGVAACADLAARIAPLVQKAALVLAPWPHDGHPDHDATGAAAIRACAGRPLAFYPIWTWHWARPGVLPLERARRVELSPAVQAVKRAAIAAHRSQLGDILPPHVIDRFTRPFEVLFV